MSAPNVISPERLMKLVGTPSAPIIIDVRTPEDFDADPRLIPSAICRSHGDVAAWAPHFEGKAVVAVCHHGAKLSHGAAAWLRHCGAGAQSLEDGFEGWKSVDLPLIPVAKIPPRDDQGRTLWVTRARPKIDRIACPWLIRRFVDPSAIFLFVAPSEVVGVAIRFSATPFDIENTFWSHRGDACTFDTMIEEWGLATPPLRQLATIIRAADTARPDLAPEAAGLLAAALGLSRMYNDDLAQLDAAMVLYDAFYRWCRDATDETHNWPTSKAKP
jgi:rhodanese-related sulfurtransferase